MNKPILNIPRTKPLLTQPSVGGMTPPPLVIPQLPGGVCPSENFRVGAERLSLAAPIMSSRKSK